ncbi:SusC/RagA family TonB-linked outer membrane protein [Sphingobacterium bambusae]|uniref:TonB-dependent receptor n=1 Tax=Sphingobacterium bambusae TaxID=662858 RepID=A0ABW6BFU0_9SPHI|nr:TonB-dependent receptor [Sphingobacterium bambusae]WPL47207.1 TonB-dependent receptor [Sphingobacterium bambusae]
MMKIYKMGLLMLLLCATHLSMAQQKVTVSGRVTDKGGQVVPGVSIKEKTGGTSTSSNVSGTFTILVPDNAMLIVTSVGYESQEIPVNGRNTLDIILASTDTDLEEVVVVGYDTRTRSKVLGSVATIGGEQLANRPVTNVSTAISGLAAGVQVNQGNGRPGSDGATIRVRGSGSLNYASSLIIIDGIQQPSMDLVNPEDIETISVLKDANTAAIYGARAANGVIMITTKKGANRPSQVSYSTIFSRLNPSVKPTFVSDYVRHMQLYNEAAENVGVAGHYTQDAIDLWTRATADPNGILAPSGLPNYVAYPNVDWGEWIYNENWLQNHNLRMDGGNDNTTYGVSTRYQNNPGIMHNTGMKRYDGRVNLQSKIKDFLSLVTNTFLYNERRDRGSDANLYNFLRQTTPGIYPMYEGQFGGAVASSNESSQLNNLLLYLYDNLGSNERTYLNTTLFAHVDILDGLKFETSFNYNARFDEVNTFANPSLRYDFSTMEPVNTAAVPAQMTTSQSAAKQYRKTFDNVLRYNKAFDVHNLGVILGHNEYYFKSSSFGATQRGLIDPTITNIGSATEMVSISGGEVDMAMRSFFGRITYDYDSKYLVEFNLRRDGSSKFGANYKYGNFLSVGLGYNISKEAFMKPLEPYVQNLRLRGSWGRLGNDLGDDLNHYAWHGVYGSNSYSFNAAPVNALRESQFGNPNLRWEGTTSTELGLEFATLKNRATVQVDYYNKQSYDGIRRAQVPLTAGFRAAPLYNQSEVRNRGIELSLAWRDKRGDFSYSLGGNFALNANMVTKFEGALQEGWVDNADGTRTWTSNLGQVSTGGTSRVLENHMINEYYLRQVYRGDGSYFNADGSVNVNGGPTTGMIRSEGDFEWVRAMKNAGYAFLTRTMNPAENYGSASLYYGDLIYADLNGDGLYGGTDDQYLTGTASAPRYIFGFNANFSYKGFDMSMIWAGEWGGQYYWTDHGYNSNIMIAGNQVTTRIAEDHYFYNPNNPTDPRTNTQGYFPRLKYGANSENINNVASDYWLYDNGFIKLRNLQLGYTFHSNLTERIKIRNLRVFFSGENLLLFTKFPGGDPEIGNSTAEYPTMRQYAFGLNIGF